VHDRLLTARSSGLTSRAAILQGAPASAVRPFLRWRAAWPVQGQCAADQQTGRFYRPAVPEPPTMEQRRWRRGSL